MPAFICISPNNFMHFKPKKGHLKFKVKYAQSEFPTPKSPGLKGFHLEQLVRNRQQLQGQDKACIFFCLEHKRVLKAFHMQLLHKNWVANALMKAERQLLLGQRWPEQGQEAAARAATPQLVKWEERPHHGYPPPCVSQPRGLTSPNKSTKCFPASCLLPHL